MTLSFDSLCAERDALRNYVLVHASSLKVFKDDKQPWFRRQETADKANAKLTVRHLTTTASCLQSLSDVPIYDTDDPPPPCPRDGAAVEKLRRETTAQFTRLLLSAGDKEWQTENEKLVYTRVRTLPIILNLADPDILSEFGDRLKNLLEGVWRSLKVDDVMSQGIGEGPRDGDGYPPNAFHTYWAIRLLREYRRKGEVLPALSSTLAAKEAVAQLWARRTLATQTALISSHQQAVDAQQLAWALSTDVLCRPEDGDQPTTADNQHAELYEAALKAFFSEQHDGQWRLYEPLFHYQKAGNAYCYTYETLAELLRLALQRRQGRTLRDRLRPYSENLVEAWHYARATALELESERGALGWCSGQHPHRTRPEAWATASVFSYLQNLRCLLGQWAAEEAKLSLSVKPSDGGSVAAGEKILGSRGDTWERTGTMTVGRQLGMLFLHPIRAARKDDVRIDPDTPLVDQSRSAVLFGPPGTSKTAVVEGLANALGWDFVEVLASSFLSEGMDSVPKSADAIFQKLMELDRCVILFDEIDELIRVRDGSSSDPFGRFLTTSMLPKLAKLWAQRRVLFFVNTNDIEAADPAIKRSQRFDAAIFVPPPSFAKKRERLAKLLGHVPPALERAAVEGALADPGGEGTYLGVFAFLRWDQIDDLAHRIMIFEGSGISGPEALKDALSGMGAELARTDWQHSEPSAGEDDQITGKAADDEGGLLRMFERWSTQRLDERRDYRADAVLQLSEDLFEQLPSGWRPYGGAGGYVVVDPVVEAALKPDSDEALELDGDGWKAKDAAGTFSFGPK